MLLLIFRIAHANEVNVENKKVKIPSQPAYQFEPHSKRKESASLITFFQKQFKNIALVELSTQQTIIIFHDWWFSPRRHTERLIAAKLTENTAELLHSTGELPQYFSVGYEHAINSSTCFAKYQIPKWMKISKAA